MTVDTQVLGTSPAPLRSPEKVMGLARMGSMFQTRLSFMRSLIRRMAREKWTFDRVRFDLDADGYGVIVYSVTTPERSYCLVGFSNYLDPQERTDRVIAEAWDVTFNLFDGQPSDADIDRLRQNTPLQESGRFSANELTLARANKSQRLFQHVVDRLAAGRQPDIDMIDDVGYLMRTTAVYGSGKFGCSDRTKIASRTETRNAFQAEMITVYLIRNFTIDLVEWVARKKGGDQAVGLDPEVKRHLGIGNATGLGMAPFLISHQVLLHNWVLARETALSRVRGVRRIEAAKIDKLRGILPKAIQHVGEWNVEDQVQTDRIVKLRDDLSNIADMFAKDQTFEKEYPLDALYQWAEKSLSLEGQELMVSLLMEPFGELVDDLCDGLSADVVDVWQPAMPIADLRQILTSHYDWALSTDYAAGDETQRFWYYSEEKFEPRMGDRRLEPGADLEMPLAIGRDVWRMGQDLNGFAEDKPVAEFVRQYPQHRHVVKRVQTAANYPYGEIADNVIGEAFRPIDMLRFKLAFFGAAKFDPKSDLWTRINMYQGAPFPNDLGNERVDDWAFATKPRAKA